MLSEAMHSSTGQVPAEPNQRFTTTHWSVVLAAQAKDPDRSTQALEALCRTYWYPLYAYARRLGKSPADAEDLTQGFFARLLQRDFLRSADRDKGHFRTFLLTMLKRYIANEWDREHAQKRGGFATVVPIDPDLAETRFASEGAHNIPPDLLFDRHWATTLLESTMSKLQREYGETGRSSLFEYLRDCLGREESALPYSEIARRMNLSEAAVKMAVRRLRVRYREILRQEIAQTVSSEEQVEEELRRLFSAF